MKKRIVLSVALMLSLSAFADVLNISTPRTTLLLQADKSDELKVIYYGTKLSDADAKTVEQTAKDKFAAYPVYGMNGADEAALSVLHADGNMSLQMVVQGTETKKDGDARITVVKMKDRVYPFFVNVFYKAYDNVDMIETWTEISHQEKKNVDLQKFLSGSLPIRRGDVWISSLYGSWANEARLCQEPLTPGVKMIKNKDAVRNAHLAHAEVMFSLDGKPNETRGRVIGAALCYPGAYKLYVDTGDGEYHRFFAGINEENSTYHLKKGEVFTTPALALTYSEEGLSGASRNFHKWGRKYRLAHGDKERRILLNSWEGVYFNINEEGMDQMMGDIAGMGGELFVMDDGWFGDKYPRNIDNSSLGDWVVDKRKLPNGIGNLVKCADKNGISFGIWIEPEMTNNKSELYEKHPDWIVKAPGREATCGRGGTQLVLDMSNPVVQDFVFKVVDDLMTENPRISYIKWDANMSIVNHGSNYLSKDNQSHLFIEYIRGLEKTCQRIRAKYPDLTIQNCSSGGGRVNWGLMPYFDEFWVSDNTDALQRIFMQWGTSYFFPSIAMGQHIGNSPSHQTFRTIPLKYRIDVAMTGRLGMELQPKNLSDEEKKLCRNAIAEYKTIRPVVQFGDLYRLVSPYDNKNVASLMYVTEQKDKAVFFWYKLVHMMNEHLPRVQMAGLDPSRTYKVHELNRIDNEPLAFEGKSFSGAYLMSNGLEIPYKHNVDYHKNTSWSSRVLVLEAE